jgi:rSAM/selenodomain-associated transferase 1
VSAGPSLIVFCREPVAGQVKTRLARRIGDRAAAALADAFIRDTVCKARAIAPGRFAIAASAPGGAARSAYFRRRARESGATIIDQGAGGLGARMARALSACGAATTGALLVGTDVPTLPPRVLRGLMTSLRRAPVVAAPSLDGGYYAIGVRGPMPPVFSAIRFGGAGVFRETMARLGRARISCRSGPAWYDVDRWDDLLVLSAHLRILARRGADNCCPATARVLRRLGLLSG